MCIRADIKADRLDCYQCEAARARDSTYWKNRWSISFDLVDAKDKGSKYLDFGIAYLYMLYARRHLTCGGRGRLFAQISRLR